MSVPAFVGMAKAIDEGKSYVLKIFKKLLTFFLNSIIII